MCPSHCSVHNTIVFTVRLCVPMPRALLKPSIQNTRRVQRSVPKIFGVSECQSFSLYSTWTLGVCFTHHFRREAYVLVSFSFNFPHHGIAFATVNVLVLDNSASLNIGKQPILYHSYFCS